MKKYFSLVLFAHSVFALPFAMIGFFLGVTTTDHPFNWVILLLVLLCMVFARNSAMAFNRYLDRDIDAKNPRTNMRDIPAGKVSANEALIFVIVNCVLFIVTTAFINPLCLYLSPVALFVVLFYSYTKRFTALCHMVLGLGLSLAPIGAYIAVTGHFALVPVLYSLAVLFWVSGFDIIYALQDEEFDKGEKLHSIPSALGRKKALRLSEFLHVLSAICVILPIVFSTFSWAYYLGVTFFCSMLIYQHLLVKPNDISKVNKAFATTNGFASVIFAACFLLDAFLRTIFKF
ncbi:MULTISPECIES: UbiA-like polyprenyltransferase [Pedobacter]|jgi:4-hydroxybenzoate polyprenyltransferase|uniref:4-hydroxybenzoate polyprenyltransferase n=1 Tax=Pedobacter cryoconitis TaxID=188932 RepID=A0A327SJA7_9SPHI|nr:UbiA-like polyprenyltransferase [Pedobacter cryoconitis]MBB5619635.1 4-hydroxybenzoate polyprenyltransferase [Pedobacter cryoconitis]MBB5647778.1 4-hydroxybenzoate polyprenyltransferase [Pedobacter cryoconitis]RAJ28625.1 4-hydroxybenzoate polyprenyltransferase [Pedobacter cryoconitis]